MSNWLDLHRPFMMLVLILNNPHKKGSNISAFGVDMCFAWYRQWLALRGVQILGIQSRLVSHGAFSVPENGFIDPKSEKCPVRYATGNKKVSRNG